MELLAIINIDISFDVHLKDISQIRDVTDSEPCLTSLHRSTMRPAAFLDRDGVICEYVDHLHRIEDFQLRPQVGEAILSLNKAGFWVFVVTNQPMIAKGFLTPVDLEGIHQKMQTELKFFGASLDAIEFCPHSAEGTVAPWNTTCQCRKPKTGMLEKLCKAFSVNLEKSFLVGDTWRDIQCAQNMNLFSYGLRGGAGFPYAETSPHQSVKPNVMANSLWEAAQHRLKKGNNC